MIGRDLRTIREACGVSMGDLADALEWKLPALSDKEREVSPLSGANVAEFVTALARIVRAREPVATVNPPRPQNGRTPTTGLAMLRVLAAGPMTTSDLASAMKHPRFIVTTLARTYARKGRIASRGLVPSENSGPPQHLYAITDAGRAYLKEFER